MNSPRTLFLLSGVFGALGICIGAFGAHSLPNMLSDLPAEELQKRLDWLETGVKYHMYHAAALLAVACGGLSKVRLPAISWTIGIVVFSGCLYAMSLTGIKILGAVVPIGGVAYIVGWVAVAWSGLRVENASRN